MSVVEIGPGTTLGDGRYIVQKQLNHGATAVVWEGFDRNLQIPVALKVMHFTSGEERKKQLMKQASAEVKTACSINHSYIAKLFDVLVENRYLIQVWELLEGTDMLGVINSLDERRIPEDMAALFFYQLLDGATYLHDCGFCHRDIKLENCMISRNMLHLKLVDFGMSKELDSVCTFNAGTPNYMAPELLRASVRRGKFDGPLYDGCAVDSWAMGVILYVMVTGQFPFENPGQENVVSTIQNITSGSMRPLPPYITQGCRDLILNLLQMDPKNRSTLKSVSRNKWLLKSAAAYIFREHVRRSIDEKSQ